MGGMLKLHITFWTNTKHSARRRHSKLKVVGGTEVKYQVGVQELKPQERKETKLPLENILGMASMSVCE